ncbi:uncharacterized protein LOC112567814 [Pomacea canaliculata]|uniref:uncharacterized protein LOC112567814 n=1 Tax=Pomacea canaliculata TaxID=400727 RepID=UPI000D73039F|nr:uncharacterized protein LOC112567814 [Pomacea canaliculata]
MSNDFIYMMVCMSLWLCVTSTDGCLTIEILGNVSINDVIEVEENSDVNLTFYVNTNSCEKITPAGPLKMSTMRKQMIIDECKIMLTKTTCQKSMQDQPCSCLYPDKTLVQFYKSFEETDYQVYFWLWPPYKDEVGDVTFVVRKPRMETECTKTCNDTNQTEADVCLPLLYVIVPSAAAVIVVVAVVAFGCLVRRLCKARNITHEEDSDEDAHPQELIQELAASQSRRHRRHREQ